MRLPLRYPLLAWSSYSNLLWQGNGSGGSSRLTTCRESIGMRKALTVMATPLMSSGRQENGLIRDGGPGVRISVISARVAV